MKENLKYSIHSIGHVNANNHEFSLKIDEPYRKALTMVDQFSHVMVIWWANEQDNPTQRQLLETTLPYAPGVTAGVFACRSEYRPNPVAITVCACLNIDLEKGLIIIPYIDAFDKTPIIDIKPYFPVSDRVNEVKIPQWAKEWPDCYEDAYKMEEIFAKFEASC